MSDISRRWRQLSGEEHWVGLTNPLELNLRKYLIHYGEMAQATYDAFNHEKASPYAGACRYSKQHFFSKVALDKPNPYRYMITKYIYATSSIPLPEAFLLRSLSREAWNKESNWMGYVAVATDEGVGKLGRRDILVAWRGTIQSLEWVEDFRFGTVVANDIFPRGTPRVHQGWYSVYTSADARSPFNKTSAREQVCEEVRRLLALYKGEELSVTVTGHSLGASLATLSAADIAMNCGITASTLVTTFAFASPRVGDDSFRRMFDSLRCLRVLRVRNALDAVPSYPAIGYDDVGEEAVVDTGRSGYLKSPGNAWIWHELEAYLHGVAGSHGAGGEFHLVVNRDVALVNKTLDAVKEEFLVPARWWCEKDKGMVQLADGSWKLVDHEDGEGEVAQELSQWYSRTQVKTISP